jgi:uncharacterized protein with HEPN domain
MSLRDPLIALEQMRDHASEAMSLLAGKGRTDLEADRVLSLAVVRLLEILGEAARRVPSETQQMHPSIPWSFIIGMRNRLIHGYDRVDLDIVWSVVVADLPPLVANVNWPRSTSITP